ncbi:hypothetical protein FK268_08730 [Tsukamurella sputi]|uniref:RiboL-PSP-HEPN domain-containing protein n=1 Tax=Tsukamurella sputi TaxID=2591848 RepID=A0A5C5RT99_9ACTN|nr:hypothetical protein [Tsukamurella sputi]TWS25275.1 hypothetical protein FK268_08730 [Tsukamurella sputi]
MNIDEQLEHLDEMFLRSITTDFPGILTERERAQVNAYLVLSHAVLEEYLEIVFEAYFQRISGWLRSGFKQLPAACVDLAFAAGAASKPPGYTGWDIRKLVTEEGLAALRKKISSNHGLKERNLQGLAQLTGISWNEFDNFLSTELADLNTLGSKRGAAGHLSPFTEKVTEISASDGPDDVRGWVTAAKNAASKIECYLTSIIRGQEPTTLIGDWDGN